MGEVERERQEQIMYDDYEESFYYDEPSSAGSDASGEALGLGIGLGIGGVALFLSGILFLIGRFDILCSSLLSLLFYVLTYKNGWETWVYIVAVLVIFGISMTLQHFVKVFRIIYTIFAGVVASLLGPVFIGYDSDARMYTIMAVCFGVTVLWGFIAWKCIVNE